MKEFWNYFEIISVTFNMLENVCELQQSSEIVLKQFLASFHVLK